MKPSRAMIPGEILCSAIGLVLAYFGGLNTGWLNHVLAMRGEAVLWMILLGIPAALNLGFALREWLHSRTWGFAKREQTAMWRGRMVLFQGVCWAYAIYFGFDQNAQLIGWIGIVCLAFCMWSYLENRRTTREIRYATAVAH